MHLIPSAGLETEEKLKPNSVTNSYSHIAEKYTACILHRVPESAPYLRYNAQCAKDLDTMNQHMSEPQRSS